MPTETIHGHGGPARRLPARRRPVRGWSRVAIGAVAVGLFVAGCGSNANETDEASTGTVSDADQDDADTTPPDDGASTGASTGASGDDDDGTTGDTAGDGEADDDGDTPGGGVVNVPDDYPTIQEGVDAANEGDIVLIASGTYNEAVDVETDNLTIRGIDRDGVILDGETTLDNGVRVLGASGVVVENLTAMNYTANGVFIVGATGYRVSYVTTYRTGDYGIYAFDSVTGQIDHAHTVGSRDAGVYIGQCYPCNAVVTDVVATNNGIGYSGTNSGGELYIVNSEFYDNRVGIVPNSGSYELCYPERETTIVGNLVYNNNAENTSAIDVALLAQRNGILVAGGIGNVIERNRVDGHLRTGIGLVPFLEEAPTDDLPTRDEWSTPCEEQKSAAPEPPEGAILWDSFDNEIRGNVVTNSGEADIAVASVDTDLSTLGNCIGDNEATTFAPTALVELAPCDGQPTAEDWAAGDLGVARWLAEQAELPPEVDWKDAPLPELGPHDNMGDPATAPAAPATDVPMKVDLAAIEVPDLP